MSNVTILCGSPRPDGNGMTLARRLAALIPGQLSIVDLYAANVRLCRGCGVCASGGVCPLGGDDFLPIMEKVAAARCVVMVSPLHFSGLSAPLVGFISRFQVFWNKDVTGRFPGVAALLVTGGSEYPGMFVAPRKVAGAAFKTLGMPLIGMVGAADTDRVPAGDNPDAISQIDALAGEILASLI
ncbi:MAG: NAD(P)H-dependent oxidoreductase [Planctomycetaceae bacterium]|nr:NAD(P)H-dependent oxidoreductase [Planctomycetaceae bacterium]